MTNPIQSDDETPARQDNPDILWMMIAARDVQIADLKAKMRVVQDFADLMAELTNDREEKT